MKIVIALIAIIFLVFAVRIGELYTQVGRYQAYWNRLNQLPLKSDEILYIALGDSTAQGIGANKPQNSYVGYIARDLQKQTDRPVHIINYSKSGAKIDDVLSRQLAKLKKYNIDSQTTVTIEIGANDMADFEPEKFEREMGELMSRLPKQTIISDIPYFGGGLNKSSEANAVEANKIMYRLAEKYNFKLASMHEATKNNSSLRTFAADWFHPSTYAYKNIWAPTFLERIND